MVIRKRYRDLVGDIYDTIQYHQNFIKEIQESQKEDKEEQESD
jgi:hypothetical protein